MNRYGDPRLWEWASTLMERHEPKDITREMVISEDGPRLSASEVEFVFEIIASECA